MTDYYPDFFARFYDLIYHQMRDRVDSNFYLNKIRKAKGKVLEVGVGTGRFFTEALKNGADIYGIDISPAMIDIAASKLDKTQQKRISLQNIVDFEISKRFDLIIAPFRVFMHIIEKEDHLKALNNIYYHLAPGGEFIFDAFVPDLNLLINGMENITDFDGEYEPGNRVKRTVTSKPDLLNQTLNVTFRIEWNENKAKFQKEWKSSMRYFFRYELEHLIERSKFQEYKILGDFEGNKLDHDSKEYILICKK